MRLLVLGITVVAALFFSVVPVSAQISANVSVLSWQDANGRTSAQGTVTNCPVTINFGASFTWVQYLSEPAPWSQPIQYRWLTTSAVGPTSATGPTLIDPPGGTGLTQGPFPNVTWSWKLGVNGPILGRGVNANGLHYAGLQIIAPTVAGSNLLYFTLNCPSVIGRGPKGAILKNTGTLIFGIPPGLYKGS